MKYTIKKALSILLTLVMLVNIFPVSAFAGSNNDEGVLEPPLVKNNRSVPPVSITVQEDINTSELYIAYVQTSTIANWGPTEYEFYGFRKYSEGDFSCPAQLTRNGAPNPIIAIVAHYDSLGIISDLPHGVDSNGSGIIILLELII